MEQSLNEIAVRMAESGRLHYSYVIICRHLAEDGGGLGDMMHLWSEAPDDKERLAVESDIIEMIEEREPIIQEEGLPDVALLYADAGGPWRVMGCSSRDGKITRLRLERRSQEVNLIQQPIFESGPKTPVIMESPFSADTPEDILRNVLYAQACMLDCLRRGEAPFASHLQYTQSLDDKIPSERLTGIEAGFSWRLRAEYTVIYTDLGVPDGIMKGMKQAKKYHRVEVRCLGEGWERHLRPVAADGWPVQSAPAAANSITTEE